ncbi:hypothetical protein WN72_18140 [Bradyrhizobium arachidis]|uniref:Secreted protein n=2 Tax=Bradyrhizobium arachidis TaxID=858423 RepID=A0AAE7TGM4_9BRAD|nr:hypothetical protein WN72_18140 [Bradyrhizobium arachidis]
MMMSNRCGLTVVAALLLFGSSLEGADAEGTSGAVIRRIASVDDVASAERLRVPIGHRQPRLRDIPPSAGPSAAEAELRRLDTEVDRKLIICRGC